jgi:hypothetical protein
MWKLTVWAKTRRPVSGVPWRDLTDEEFAALETNYAGLDRYFYHEPEQRAATEPEPVAPPAPRRRRRKR